MNDDDSWILFYTQLNSIRLDEKNMSANDLLLESVRAAELHGATFLYSDAVTKYANKRNNDPLAILRRLTALWGFHTLITYSDQAFKEDYLSASQLKSLERVYLQECKSLRKQVIGLTDAWGYPDFILKAPIAKYDGRIYECKCYTSLVSFFVTLMQHCLQTILIPC